MREPQERSELIRAVKKRGEAVSTVAARLGVPASTAYRWMRVADAEPAPVMRPTFVEVVSERAERSTILVRVGVAELEVVRRIHARPLVGRSVGGGIDRFLTTHEAPDHVASGEQPKRDRCGPGSRRSRVPAERESDQDDDLAAPALRPR